MPTGGVFTSLHSSVSTSLLAFTRQRYTDLLLGSQQHVAANQYGTIALFPPTVSLLLNRHSESKQPEFDHQSRQVGETKHLLFSSCFFFKVTLTHSRRGWTPPHNLCCWFFLPFCCTYITAACFVCTAILLSWVLVLICMLYTALIITLYSPYHV